MWIELGFGIWNGRCVVFGSGWIVCVFGGRLCNVVLCVGVMLLGGNVKSGIRGLLLLKLMVMGI